MYYPTEVLLSIDFEFSHPSPRMGSALAFGWTLNEVQRHVAVSIDRGTSFSYGDPTLEEVAHGNVILPFREGAQVTDWVAENQRDLLSKSKEQTATSEDWVRPLVAALREYKEAKKVIPVGWCLGSDYAYLLDLLGENCDLVHYEFIDISNVYGGLYGDYRPTMKMLTEKTGLVNENEHEPLSDARFQLKVLEALAAKVRVRQEVLQQASVDVDFLLKKNLL